MCFSKKKEKKDIPMLCEFCEYATILNDADNVLCAKKGIVEKNGKCGKYVYDPLKRVPRPRPELPKLSEDDVI